MVNYLDIRNLSDQQKDALCAVMSARGFKHMNTIDTREVLAIYLDIEESQTLCGDVSDYTSYAFLEITLQEFFDKYAPEWANSLQVCTGLYYWVNTNDLCFTSVNDSDSVYNGMSGKEIMVEFDEVLFEFTSKETPLVNKESHLLEINAGDGLGVYTTVHDTLGNQVNQVTNVKVYKNHLEVTAFNTTKTGKPLYEHAHQDLSTSTFKLYGGYIKITAGEKYDANTRWI